MKTTQFLSACGLEAIGKVRQQASSYVVLSFAAALAGCPSPKPATDRETILQVSAEGQHVQVVSRLEKHAWHQSDDPLLLLTYCSSMFIAYNKRPTCDLAPGSERGIVRLADGLWKAWSGRTKQARSIYSRLASKSKWVLWVHMARLELARYTENHRELGSLLVSMNGFSQKQERKANRLYKNYRLEHLQATHSWDELDSMLAQHTKKKILEDVDLFSAQAHILYVQGKIAQLRTFVRSASSDVQGTTTHKLWWLDLLWIEDGSTEWQKALAELEDSSKSVIELKLQKAYNELLSETADASGAAIRTLRREASTHPNHIGLILDIAVTLAAYHKPEEAGRIFGLVDRKVVNIEDFANYHVLSAWNRVYGGQLEAAKIRIDRALQMAPTHPAANWLKALIAKQQNDPTAGAEAVRQLVKADPYNENYRSLARHFPSVYNTPELEELYKSSPEGIP